MVIRQGLLIRTCQVPPRSNRLLSRISPLWFVGLPRYRAWQSSRLVGVPNGSTNRRLELARFPQHFRAHAAAKCAVLSQVRNVAKHILSIRGQTLELNQLARCVTCTRLSIAEAIHDKVSARITLQGMRLIQSKAHCGIALFHMTIGLCRHLCLALFPCCPTQPVLCTHPGNLFLYLIYTLPLLL